MPTWSPGQMRTLVVILSALLVTGAYQVWRRSAQPVPALVIEGRGAEAAAPLPVAPSPQPSSAAAPAAMAAPSELVVHVAGAVKRAGVYRFAPGARWHDAVKAAGGAKAAADLDAVNLAARLEDGIQLYIPRRGERPGGGASPAAAPALRASRPSGPALRAAGRPASGRAAKFTDPSQGSVNLNTADADELQRLPGVGPATAQRILDYRREIGRYTAPEQLMDVPGIGEKRFAKMQPFVRVR